MKQVADIIVEKYRSFLYYNGYIVQLLKETLLFFKKRGVGHKVLTMQILFTGVEALSIVALLALSLGAVIIIQGISLLPQFGQGDLIYTIMVTVITRELGPILVAFIIIARSGTAIATELGNMVISHEIEALVSVGINPISYIGVPRFIGVSFSMLILNIYFNLFGLIGSYFISLLIKPVPFIEYFHKLMLTLSPADMFSSLWKSLIFGLIISISSTYYGFKVQISSTEIPQVVIKAVGQAFSLCMLANAVITFIYYI